MITRFINYVIYGSNKKQKYSTPIHSKKNNSNINCQLNFYLLKSSLVYNASRCYYIYNFT